jgi:hypothetical protein
MGYSPAIHAKNRNLLLTVDVVTERNPQGTNPTIVE